MSVPHKSSYWKLEWGTVSSAGTYAVVRISDHYLNTACFAYSLILWNLWPNGTAMNFSFNNLVKCLESSWKILRWKLRSRTFDSVQEFMFVLLICLVAVSIQTFLWWFRCPWIRLTFERNRHLMTNAMKFLDRQYIHTLETYSSFKGESVFWMNKWEYYLKAFSTVRRVWTALAKSWNTTKTFNLNV